MRRNEIPDEWCNLSWREKRIRHMLHDGKSRKEIGKVLDLTPLQVEGYIRSINKKISLCMETRKKGFIAI